MAMARILHRGCWFHSEEDDSSFCGVLWHWAFITHVLEWGVISRWLGIWSDLSLVENNQSRVAVGTFSVKGQIVKFFSLEHNKVFVVTIPRMKAAIGNM